MILEHMAQSDAYKGFRCIRFVDMLSHYTVNVSTCTNYVDELSCQGVCDARDQNIGQKMVTVQLFRYHVQIPNVQGRNGSYEENLP